MPIRLAPKEGFAEIPPEVEQKIKDLRAERASQLSQEINKLKLERGRIDSEYHRQRIDAEIQGMVNSFQQLKRTGGGNVISGAKRGGFSGIMMRMRRLPFEKFYLKERKSQSGRKQEWMIGLTRPIITEITGSHHGKSGRTVGTTRYDMGKYFIAILCDDIGTHNTTFHLLPERNPSTQARHMHHHVDSRFDRDQNISKNPLDWTPHNCFGSFAGGIKGSFLNADIPELFRMLYMFTKVLNPQSPLLRLPALPHIREVNE